ncbi:MAG: hypothetical protein PUA93_00265 [Eubacteriales bacterium]|nr:hypothetical protein [Eubacteriales bacterium]
MNSKKLLTSLVALASIVTLASCQKTPASSESSKPSTTPSSSPVAEKTKLTMSVTYKDDATRMKFVSGKGALAKADSYTDPAGNSYIAGDFKPGWKALQNRLDFVIDDATPSIEQDINKNFSKQVTENFQTSDGKLINIVQGDSSQIISEGTTHGSILDLSQYLDKMPNFKKFLTDNPVVKATISDASGHIYYAPYFDGYDDLERMLVVRKDWAEKLLDGDTLPTGLDTGKALLSKSYTPFMPDALDKPIDIVKDDGTKGSVTKKYTGGDVIAKMNALSTLNGSTAVKTLRDWIDATYKNADGTPFYGTKRSELFVGGKAAYDVDELVALFRCVYLNPGFLNGDATKTMVPFFPRSAQTDRNADLWRFAQDFGVRGVESRNGYLFVGSDGKLHDCRDTDEFINAVEKLHQMYSEGLIAQNFDSKEGLGTSKDDGSGDAREVMYNNNTGFAIYDYNQTTVAYNEKYKGGQKGFLIVPTLPAVASFDGGTSYIHYSESWRSVKTQGWCITSATKSDSAKLTKALALFDYLYSADGNQLMSYGPKEYGYLATDSNGNVKTIDYQGKQVPQLSDATKTQLADSKIGNSNYTNYYRYFVGATYPVGYVKEQGMEYQTVSSKALSDFDKVNKAIEIGVLQHVNHKKDNANHLYDIVPTTLPFNTAEQNSYSQNFTNLNNVFTMDKKSENVIEDLIKGGFGTYLKNDFSKANFKTTVDTTLGLTSYLAVCNTAYERFKTLW